MLSNNRDKILKPVKDNILAFIIFLLLWYIFSLFFEEYILPNPYKAVINTLQTLANNFDYQVLITSYRIFTGFILSMFIGIILGFIGYIFNIKEKLNTIMILFQVIPGVILGVILLLIFGLGSIVPIILIIVLSTPLLAVNIANALSKKSAKIEELIRSIGGNFTYIVKDAYIPAIIPALRTNMTIGFGIAIKIVVLGEYIASQDGLGYLLNIAKTYFRMSEVFFYLSILLIFMLLFQIISDILFVIVFDKYLGKD